MIEGVIETHLRGDTPSSKRKGGLDSRQEWRGVSGRGVAERYQASHCDSASKIDESSVPWQTRGRG